MSGDVGAPSAPGLVKIKACRAVDDGPPQRRVSDEPRTEFLLGEKLASGSIRVEMGGMYRFPVPMPTGGRPPFKPGDIITWRVPEPDDLTRVYGAENDGTDK